MASNEVWSLFVHLKVSDLRNNLIGFPKYDKFLRKKCPIPRNCLIWRFIFGFGKLTKAEINFGDISTVCPETMDPRTSNFENKFLLLMV